MKHAWTVFKKEITDIFRDRKTLFSTLLLPLILMPLLFTILGRGISSMEEDLNENYTVALMQNARQPEARAYIEGNILSGLEGLTILEGDGADLIQNEKALCALDVPDNAAQLIEQGKTLPVTVIYDSAKTKSQGGMARMMDHLQKYSDAVVNRRLAEIGVTLSDLAPVNYSSQEISAYLGEGSKQGSGNMMVSMLLPMMLTLLICTGGMGAATDLVAGEKERQTLEPLLTTCAPRGAILVGKYAAVTLFGLISMTATLLSYILSMRINPALFGDNIAINLPWQAGLLVFIPIVLLGMTISSIQIAISAFARSFKEGQTYLSLLMLVAMVPAYGSMMLQAGDVTAMMMLVPVFNVTCSIKLVLGGLFDYGLLLIGLISSLFYLTGALILSSRLFSREWVLFRS